MDQDLKGLVKEILTKGYLLSLATVDESGPWVSDLIYVFDDDLNIYWISAVSRRHSKALVSNNKVAATITLTTGPDEPEIQLQIEGSVQKLEGDNLDLANKHRIKSNKPKPSREGEVLENSRSWYKLVPAKIEITYSPKWGYEKKVLELKKF